ncbi:Mur ligase, partial [Francisella tularensis subsp. holarctica]|nr:Mur ligase [Francisella tularensis subsp. holarctica]
PLVLPLLIRKDLGDKGYDISNTYFSLGDIDGVMFLVEKLESNDIAIFCCQSELEEVANYLEVCEKK